MTEERRELLALVLRERRERERVPGQLSLSRAAVYPFMAASTRPNVLNNNGERLHVFAGSKKKHNARASRRELKLPRLLLKQKITCRVRSHPDADARGLLWWRGDQPKEEYPFIENNFFAVQS